MCVQLGVKAGWRVESKVLESSWKSKVETMTGAAVAAELFYHFHSERPSQLSTWNV